MNGLMDKYLDGWVDDEWMNERVNE